MLTLKSIELFIPSLFVKKHWWSLQTDRLLYHQRRGQQASEKALFRLDIMIGTIPICRSENRYM